MGRAIGAIAILSLSLALSGCVAAWGDSHKITHKDENSITIEFDRMFTDDHEMKAVADRHCGPRGGKAALQSDRRTIGGIDIRHYGCERTPDAQKAPVELLREAADRFRAKDWPRAAELATAAIATEGMSVNQTAAAYLLRSYCRYAMGRFNEALADANRSVQLRPDLTIAVRFRDALIRDGGKEQAAPRQRRPRPTDEEIGPPVIDF